MKNCSVFVVGATLLTLVACGNKEGSSNPQARSELLTEDGNYTAKLVPMNNHLAGDVSGDVLVKVKGDSFQVEVKVKGAPSKIRHAQAIHVADACPTLSDDINKDGVIDAIEAKKSLGGILVPLDSDLKTQLEAHSTFPTADFSGNYFYKQTVALKDMMKDLMSKDTDGKDNIVKLNKSNLSLAGRQVVIYGIGKDAILPETVSSINGQDKLASLPIACGSLVKMTATAGSQTSGGGKE